MENGEAICIVKKLAMAGHKWTFKSRFRTNDYSSEPATLIRAARDFVEKDAAFATQVALCAIAHLLAGGGYEPTARDMVRAHQYLTEAAAKCDRSEWATSEVDHLISQGAISERQDFLQVLVAEQGRQV